MSKKIIVVILLIIFMLFVLTGCVPGNGSYTIQKPAGFFSGIWHGWIAPISLIIGLIDKNIRVYETVNTGWFYDFGFYIAIISGFGGLSLCRKKSKD